MSKFEKLEIQLKTLDNRLGLYQAWSPSFRVIGLRNKEDSGYMPLSNPMTISELENFMPSVKDMLGARLKDERGL